MKQLLPENSGDSNGLPILRPEYAGMEPAGNELPPTPPSFKLQKFLVFLLKYWWIPVITLLLGIGGGYEYVRTMPPTFVSGAQLIKPVSIQLGQGMFTEDPNFLGTQAELLQSDTLRERTLEHIKALSTNTIPLEKDGQPLAVQISVAASAKSSVFTVVGASADPVFVQVFVDALVLEYLQYKKDARKLVSDESIASIIDQELKFERDLKEKQEDLASYERSNNLFVVRAQYQVNSTYLANLRIKVSDETLELRLLEAAMAEKQENHFLQTNTLAMGSTNASAATAAAAQPLSIDKTLEMLKSQREKMSVDLRPKHPKIKQLDAEIEKTEMLLNLAVKQTDQELANRRRDLERTIAENKKAIAEWDDQVKAENDLIAMDESLQRNVQEVASYFERLRGMQQNVEISRGIEQDTLQILHKAAPAYRSHTAETTMMTKCSVGGLFGGLAIVFLIALRNDEFATSNDVNERFGEVIVGQVPDVRGVRKKKPLALLQDNDDRHSYAESYRNLRSALFYLANDGSRPKLVLVTSAIPNEGKSTIAANLAKIMAVGGSKVLLVDGDMRRGSLHAQFGSRQEPGFTDLLRQPGDLAAIIQETSVPNLKFIGRGSNVMNPGDLLLGPQLDQVLKEFREGFDYVVLDSCPVFAADDVTTLAPKLDGALFVVRSQFSRAKVVQEALDLLYQRQARVLGLVFNRARSSSRKDHYYNYSQYHSHKAA